MEEKEGEPTLPELPAETEEGKNTLRELPAEAEEGKYKLQEKFPDAGEGEATLPGLLPCHPAVTAKWRKHLGRRKNLNAPCRGFF
ncbi:hypothetical protein [Prolixibacter sp. NT017]|uniref:hypothetical protein n=1 Tax=Prolixibacter sp. NT017 TaxID=2652390 RepID=UPI00129929FC|nr:hypothetical protein [Prolixibacter sp. NT017]